MAVISNIRPNGTCWLALVFNFFTSVSLFCIFFTVQFSIARATPQINAQPKTQCTLRVVHSLNEHTLTNSGAARIRAKGYNLVIQSNISESEYRKSFKVGDYGYMTKRSTRGLQPIFLWKIDRADSSHPLVEYNLKDYFSHWKSPFNQKLEDILPHCHELLNKKNEMAHDYIIRKLVQQSGKALLGQVRPGELSWGKFFLAAEVQLYNKYHFEQSRRVQERAYQRYAEILNSLNPLSGQMISIGQVNELRRILFKFGMQNYCAGKYKILDYLNATQPCGNCVARTLLMISVLKDLNIHFLGNYVLGVQVFSDHIQPVLFNKRENKVIDLVSGQLDQHKFVEIYKPEYLLWAFNKGLKINRNKNAHWYFSSDMLRRQLILRQNLISAPATEIISSTLDISSAIRNLFQNLKNKVNPLTDNNYIYSFIPGLVPYSGVASDFAENQYVPIDLDSPVEHEQSPSLVADGLNKLSNFLNGNRKTTKNSFIKMQSWLEKNIAYFDNQEKEFIQSKFLISNKSVGEKISRLKEVFIFFKDESLSSVHAENKCYILAGYARFKELTSDLEFVNFSIDGQPYCIHLKVENLYKYVFSDYLSIDFNTLSQKDRAKELQSFYQKTVLDFEKNFIDAYAELLEFKSAQVLSNRNILDLFFILNSICDLMDALPNYDLNRSFLVTELISEILNINFNFYQSGRSHREFLGFINSANTTQLNNFYRIMISLNGILKYANLKGLNKDTSSISRLLNRRVLLTPTEAHYVLNPLRFILVSLINDKEKIYIPKMSSAEKKNFRIGLEKIRDESRSDVHKNSTTAADLSSPTYFSIIPGEALYEQDPLIHSATSQHQKRPSVKPINIFDREIIEINPQLFAVILGAQLGWHKEHMIDVSLPIYFRLSESLMPYWDKYDLNLYGLLSPILLLEKITPQTRSPLNVLSDFHPLNVNLIPTYGVLQSSIDEAYQLYFTLPQEKYLFYKNDNKSNVFIVAGSIALPYRIQKLTSFLSDYYYNACISTYESLQCYLKEDFERSIEALNINVATQDSLRPEDSIYSSLAHFHQKYPRYRSNDYIVNDYIMYSSKRGMFTYVNPFDRAIVHPQ